jgi:hypothetical protein
MMTKVLFSYIVRPIKDGRINEILFSYVTVTGKLHCTTLLTNVTHHGSQYTLKRSSLESRILELRMFSFSCPCTNRQAPYTFKFPAFHS